MNERRKGASYEVEHEKRYSISMRNHVLFCLFCKDTDNKVSDNFQFLEIVHWPNIYGPKIIEHF